MDPLTIVIVLALVATGGTLGLGLLAMSGGGYVDKDFGTPLMWTRIGLHVLTLLLLGLAVLVR
ncbi:MAG TPA: hypothetical protein VK629_07025 [Steroidobacteraceae bacterium]|nr:hypothetical protein [Steroidobacteraceae bacterium]